MENQIEFLQLNTDMINFSFKKFLTEAASISDKSDMLNTIEKLPKSHQQLLKDYKFGLEGGNSLKNDKEHVGFNDLDNKKIVVAAPWHYGRSFAFLHEIGHLVWAFIMSPQLKKQWSEIVKQNDKRLKQNDEENFCMAYAANYSKHPPITHTHKEWQKFIEELP